MSADEACARTRFVAPAPVPGYSARFLVVDTGRPGERRVRFFDHLEIGRDDGKSDPAPGQLLISDPTISRRHCVLRQVSDGRCVVQDVSRNGTRVDGRRIVPNLEVDVRAGQVIAVGGHTRFVLEAGPDVAARRPDPSHGGTLGAPGFCVATVLVGDIKGYTGLVRRVPSADLQQSVGRVFERLARAVGDFGGTVKEYQGDALLAFWEGDLSGGQAVAACRAALGLDRLARELTADPATWQLRDEPLRLDWALATGPVVLDSFGGDRPAGLSLIGEPVVLAFRLEKFATDETGPIVVCRATRAMAGGRFRFRNLGRMTAQGFDQPDEVFALEGEADAEAGR